MEYPVIFRVITIMADLMASQKSLKKDIDVLDTQGSYLVELTAITLLIDAVLEDTCIWVS